MLVEERGKGVVVFLRALLQFAVFDQVDILQSIVVGQDIVLVGTLSDVQQTPVVAIDIDNGRSPGLPIDVGMLSHRPLTDGISHICVVAIITRIAEHNGFIVRESWTLVGEELILHILLAEPFVAIDAHRLPGSFSRPGTSDARLTKLIQL